MNNTKPYDQYLDYRKPYVTYHIIDLLKFRVLKVRQRFNNALDALKWAIAVYEEQYPHRLHSPLQQLVVLNQAGSPVFPVQYNAHPAMAYREVDLNEATTVLAIIKAKHGKFNKKSRLNIYRAYDTPLEQREFLEECRK